MALPLPLELPPDNRDSRRAAIRAALFPPKMTGAAVVGCMPAIAAAPVGMVDKRRDEGCIEGRARVTSLRGDLRALAGGRLKDGTASVEVDEGRRPGRRIAFMLGAEEEEDAIDVSAAETEGRTEVRGRVPTDNRRIAFSDRIGPMCEVRRCLKDGVGGASEGPAGFDTSGATSPEDDGAMEKEFSALANDELARSANGDRGADALAGSGGGGMVSSCNREKVEGDSATGARPGARVESGLLAARIALDALSAINSAARLESLPAANVDGAVHICVVMRGLTGGMLADDDAEEPDETSGELYLTHSRSSPTSSDHCTVFAFLRSGLDREPRNVTGFLGLRRGRPAPLCSPAEATPARREDDPDSDEFRDRLSVSRLRLNAVDETTSPPNAAKAARLAWSRATTRRKGLEADEGSADSSGPAFTRSWPRIPASPLMACACSAVFLTTS